MSKKNWRRRSGKFLEQYFFSSIQKASAQTSGARGKKPAPLLRGHGAFCALPAL
jgi:hypothetical protein